MDVAAEATLLFFGCFHEMRIDQLPLDAWVIIMMHIDNKDLLRTFDTLILSRALNIPLKYKLDTFWILVSQARYLGLVDLESPFPDVEMYRESFHQLQEMGVSSTEASEAVGVSNGTFEGAVFHLWSGQL